MKQIRFLVVLTALLIALDVTAAIQSTAVDYQDGDQPLKGYLYWDDAISGRRPGVIVVHEWWGLNDYAKKRARMLAEQGYVAFAADLYGADRVTKHGKTAGEWMKQITANQTAWQQRALLGIKVLQNSNLVEPDQIAAIGYCFGGSTVMQMAYSGAPLKGVVSFHGSLPVATAQQAKMVKAKVQIAHGAEDHFISEQRVKDFQLALNQAGVEVDMTIYPSAQHSFTNPEADSYKLKGAAYNQQADQQSWLKMVDFLKAIFR